MEHITTYTGIHFYPTAPEIEKLEIRDIAHALSLICRGNGHVTVFFSVGQHCILCCKEALARGYSKRLALACLLHDASEAYLSDVPRPFKKLLKEYNRYEDALLDLIYERFLGSPLTEEEQKCLREIDDDLLYFDLSHLLKEAPDLPAPDIHVPLSYDFVPFAEVEAQYLELFFSLYA